VNQYNPDTVSPPGETLQDLLDEMNISQANLARFLNRPFKTINEIIKGKCAITAETAIQFEEFFGVEAEFWLARETRYRLYLARRKP
jgi:HTH-type transcriptional regulator/antitoxin HigA